MPNLIIGGRTNLPYPVVVHATVDEMFVGISRDGGGAIIATIDLFYPEDLIPSMHKILSGIQEKGQAPKVYIYSEDRALTIVVFFELIGATDNMVQELSLMEDFRAALRRVGTEVPRDQFRVIAIAEAGGFTSESIKDFGACYREAGSFVVNLAKKISEKIVQPLVSFKLDKIHYSRPSPF